MLGVEESHYVSMIGVWGTHQTQPKKKKNFFTQENKANQFQFYWLIAQRLICYLNPGTTWTQYKVAFQRFGRVNLTLKKSQLLDFEDV